MKQAEERLRKGGAVTVAVPENVRSYVDGFRKRYDPHMTHIIPHITLVFAHDLDAQDWFERRAALAAELAKIDPFEVTVAQVATFPQEFVLWLEPTDTHGELAALRETVLRLLPGIAFDHLHDFVPHISIGFLSSQSTLAQAQGAVQHELVPFSFRVSAISFLQADAGDVWQCVDAIGLRSDSCI